MTSAAQPGGEVSRGIAWLLLAVTLFACQDSLAKFLTGRFAVLEIVGMRYIFHLAILAPILFWKAGSRVVATSRPKLQIVRSLMLLATIWFVNLGLRHLPLATVTAIGFSAPLIVTALAALFLHERVGPRRWAAVFVGFAGVMVIARPSGDGFDPALLFPLAGALCNALYHLATRALAGRDSALTTIFWTGFAACVVVAPAMPLDWQTPDLPGCGLLALYGLLGLSSHFTLILAYRHASASVLAPFNYVQLLLAIISGAIFFHNRPDAWTYVGTVLICGSGVYVWYRQRRLGIDA